MGFIAGCHGCGLLFVNPPPEPADVTAFYSPEGTWGQSFDAGRRELLTRDESPPPVSSGARVRPRRPRDFLLHALKPYIDVFEPPPGAAVLDFGCGDGKLLNVLLDAGWRTFGIEPSLDVAFGRHTRLDRIPDRPSFDFVVLHHVLEHLAEPLTVLRQLAAALRPGGVMFISVPRIDTLPSHGDLRYCINARTHPVCFSEACLRDLLARCGLETAGVLDDPALDEQITAGIPMRLRIVARKAGTPPRVARPLAPAAAALAEYRRSARQARWANLVLPVRTRAFLMEREQRRKGDRRAAAA